MLIEQTGIRDGSEIVQAERAFVLTAGEEPIALQPAREGALSSIRIEAAKAWPSLKLRELWGYRELIYFLVWRDVKVRYKQTILGTGWALIQPLFTMAIFTVVFGRLAKMPSDNIPYPLFALTALVPWSYFANTLNQGSNSLVTNSSLIKKVYFPRLAIPVAKVLSGLVEFGLSFVLLIGMVLYYGFHPSVRILWIPLVLLLAMITSLGSSFWLSALNVRVRDVEHILPFLVQIWMYATSVAYPSSLLPPKWRIVYAINPMVGVAEGFRWALVGAKAPGPIFLVSTVVAVVVLVSGAYWFRRLEKTFADVL